MRKVFYGSAFLRRKRSLFFLFNKAVPEGNAKKYQPERDNDYVRILRVKNMKDVQENKTCCT